MELELSRKLDKSVMQAQSAGKDNFLIKPIQEIKKQRLHTIDSPKSPMMVVHSTNSIPAKNQACKYFISSIFNLFVSRGAYQEVRRRKRGKPAQIYFFRWPLHLQLGYYRLPVGLQSWKTRRELHKGLVLHARWLKDLSLRPQPLR